ncbi:amino acid aminotransferase [Halioxenophilus sp. WMMB6]|uniref:amino acid aminotransferase n=1 Tax=Halioxenophilus sp. WMMB6 TaxID=3073815 RepID=UPI00295EB13D|nr:amino acid aminotransferase [Halioxenophilus sp. WMMB6]
MFELLPTLPADPILGLTVECRADTNLNKVDLGVGVFKDESGNTPVLAAVKEAERQYFDTEQSKAYLPAGGTPRFIGLVNDLVFGSGHPALQQQRVVTIQGTGGCGSLRVAAELIKRANSSARIWISDPSWPNHSALLGSSGLGFCQYPYYDQNSNSIPFEQMLAALAEAEAGDLVLIHACCHNPSGADLSEAQWQAVTELAKKNGFIPFIDMAYQGFGQSLEADAYGIRYMAEQLPELVVANSFSKNFGLYRERVGSVSIVVKDPNLVATVNGQMMNIARTIYSMPPAHGAALVETVLADTQLRQKWQEELGQMRDRIKSLRSALVQELKNLGCSRDFSFIEAQQGMFSFLGLSKSQVEQLKTAYSIYMVDSSRISICGLNSKNMNYVARAIVDVVDK